MNNVDCRGRKNVCRLAISQIRRKKIEVEKRMRWFKKLGEPIKNELTELFELNEEQKKYEKGVEQLKFSITEWLVILGLIGWIASMGVKWV